MPSMLVTCPETAHLERIDYEEHPLGMLIRACSRFEPGCALQCHRTCAARLDRKRRELMSDEAETQVECCRTLVDLEL